MSDQTPYEQAIEFMEQADWGHVTITRRDKPPKEYPTVALRVVAFRMFYDTAYGITTEQVTREGDDPDIVVMRARILHYCAPGSTSGRIIATGTAEEVRGDGLVNKTSALENAETSAIGRALATFGLTGEEMASANEMDGAIEQQAKPKATVETLGKLTSLCADHGMNPEEIDQYRATLRVATWADLTQERAERLLSKMEAKLSREYAEGAAADHNTDNEVK